MKTFDEQLRKIMATRRIQQKEICSDLGFHQSTFSKWYNGNASPPISAITKIAQYLELPTDYFLLPGTYTEITEEPHNEYLTDDEKIVCRRFLQLPKGTQKQIIEIIEKLVINVKTPE